MGSNPLPTKNNCGEKKRNTKLIIYTILNQINFASKTQQTVKQKFEKLVKNSIQNQKRNTMKHLIKVLERGGNKKSSRRSINLIKMAGLSNFNRRWCCLKYLVSRWLLLVN
jgi:hypothetical protein